LPFLAHDAADRHHHGGVITCEASTVRADGMLNALHVRDDKIYFPEPLTQATIIQRRNRFVIDVDLDGAVVGCHCPTTGRIGTLVLDGLPCLLSRSHNTARTTPYTVEAVSVDPPDTRAASWIGINQNAANRYVEQALAHQMLSTMVTVDTLRREQVLGHSRLDFLVNDHTYIEVKTPLDNLQVTLGGHIQTRPRAPFDSTDRLVRHIGELGASLTAHQRAILLICFLYDNPGFQVQASRRRTTVKAQVSESIRQGVEIWQVNFQLDATGVRVLSYHELTQQLSA
jgi:sugar fermentation stimulation protein A